METNNKKDIIIFDGECNLCNGVIGWLMKFAPTATFNFVPFQSPKGQQLLRHYNKATDRLDTVILINQTGIHTHSDGFLKIVAKIPKWKRVAALLGFIPRMFRDYVYKTASRNRLKWFGVSKSCTINFG
jgi:predicted DCC family thiol-disulfide oxidoreductase YuxK